MDLHDALARFLAQLRADGRSTHTIDQYERHVQLLAAWAPQDGVGPDVAAIDHEDLARFLGSPEALQRSDGRPKKASTVNALRSSLKGFFRYLHGAGYIASDPSRLSRRANCGAPPPRALAESDQVRLLEALAAGQGEAARRDHALFHFLLATGCRVSAALRLEVEDIDLAQGEAVVRGTKGNRAERVFLPPAVREHFQRYLEGRTSGPAFPRQDGCPLNCLQLGGWGMYHPLLTVAARQRELDVLLLIGELPSHEREVLQWDPDGVRQVLRILNVVEAGHRPLNTRCER